MQTDRQIYCLYTQISLSAALDSNAVPLKHYWELAEPDLDAAGATKDLLECSPRSRPSFKTATCSVVAGCPHTSRRTDERKKKKSTFPKPGWRIGGPSFRTCCQRAIISISHHVLLLLPLLRHVETARISPSSGHYGTI